MTFIEQQILENLMALETAATRMAQTNPKAIANGQSPVANRQSPPDLLPIFSRLDELTRQLPPGTEPDLLHFLHRKSYQKACALLQQRQRGKI